MAFPFRLAAVDMDDTLLDPEKRVSAANREALEQLRSRGCRVVLASGRRHENMVRFYHALGLDDFAVSCQGARVEHVRTGEILHQAVLSPPDSDRIFAGGRERGLTVIVWRKDGIFAAADSAWVGRYASQTGGEPIQFKAEGELRRAEAEKMVWVGEQTGLRPVMEAARALCGGHVALTDAHDWCLEFSDTGASKGEGLAAIARRTGVPREQVLAFGDGYNDVAMLQWAGLGVAMAHGRESARRAARKTSPPGDPGDALGRSVAELLKEFE
jgi:hypothetical protein